MKPRIGAALGFMSLIAMLSLTGCTTTSPAGTASAVSAATPSATPSPSETASDIQAAVQTFVKALDDLGIKHSDPVRTEVGLSGAKARFDITVDGFDAGINVFPDAEMLETWGEASDSFGGIYVASGNAVLTLNSSEGITDSAQIAPQIAAKVGGEAHGV